MARKKTELDHEPATIYLVGEVGAVMPNKIGVAMHLDKRMSSLQCGNPRRLELLSTWLVPERWRALEVESHVLLHFKGHNRVLLGEWIYEPKSVCIKKILEAIEAIV